MWDITSREIILYGRSPGGDRFTELVDALIYARAFCSGIPYSDIHTNLRTTVADGGVDTQVERGTPTDSTGHLNDKTIWQYKATEYKNISDSDLEQEVNKSFSKKCLSEGYAYRFCICDALPVNTQHKWRDTLTRFIRKIRADAPEAQVLTADDLAAWSNLFPSVSLRFFRPDLADGALHFDAWKENIRALTTIFVQVPEWQEVEERIKEYVNFAIAPSESVLSIQGAAGVGKSRMVCEVLASLKSSENLVVYTNDEQHAQAIARQLANNKSLIAILVADECSVKTRVQLGDQLQGHLKRVRVIAIDNAGERPPSGAPEYWIRKISNETVEKILELNFPHVPEERRRAYASLSAGFVRLAADMCRHDAEIARAGHVGPVMGNIHDYYRRLSEQEREVIEALSLLSKVGFKEDVAKDLEHLCSLTKMDKDKARSIALRLHDVPGFIAWAGRFLYVTPEIIAQVAFEAAWRRWGETDPERFLLQIHESILESFLRRVAHSAPAEVRRLVGEFFRKRSYELRPSDLASVKEVDRLEILTEANPDVYLTILRNLIEDATPDELISIAGEAPGRWGPRRHIVWLLERMVAFPDNFSPIEAMLLRLALAESEPAIGNNATSVWKRLFSITLSGTSLPFGERLTQLERRIYSEDEKISALAMEALDEIFHLQTYRMTGQPVVAGRIPPKEWNPRTDVEYKACLDAALSLLCKVAISDLFQLRARAHEIIVEHIRLLLGYGYLNQIQALFSSDKVSDDLRVRTITATEEFLHFDARKDTETQLLTDEYDKDVSRWLENLKPTDIHSRIVTAVGIDSWHRSLIKEEEQWQAEIKSLATELFQNRAIIEKEMKWLCSDRARSAVIMGMEIGELDKDGSLSDLIIKSALLCSSTAFAKGYIQGLLRTSPSLSDRINALLDEIEAEAPKLACELSIAGAELTKAVERTLRLIDGEKLPLEFLQALGYLSLNEHYVAEILRRLARAVELGKDRIASIAISFTAFQLQEKKRDGARKITENEEILKLIWRLIELTAADSGREAYWWGRILESLILINPEKVAVIAADAIVGEFHQKESATKILIKLAASYPDIVMKSVGKVMLDEEKGWRFFIDKYDDLIKSLPVDIVIQWLKSNGVEAARRLARHLPAPHLDANGEPEIPPLTEFMFREFEADDRVFKEFGAGMHSLQLYSGDIAAQHEKEVEVAKKFLHHPLRRVREWAQIEIQRSLWQAKKARLEDEEFGI